VAAPPACRAPASVTRSTTRSPSPSSPATNGIDRLGLRAHVHEKALDDRVGVLDVARDEIAQRRPLFEQVGRHANAHQRRGPRTLPLFA
jgi:hypothetical protein